ncbi:MAG: hypothetical protein NZ733_05380 [Aigarchaeota archaeon]|nr:hypothetical protein [Aigarchaeota archaeon]MCS7127505.1 hypothetical protein [Candidatus Calditenuaceae archaeon]MDW8043556.1 hypothetical protein [Nitrososphaerota archaeon]
MREPKYQVEVKQSSRALRVERQLVEELKGSLSAKVISRMRKEYVDCPVAGAQLPFLICYNCTSFIRRVSGVVHCEGKEQRLRDRT